MTHIPYTGAGPAVLALLGGQVDAVASGPSHRGAADQGRQAARAGALGRKPLQSLPDVPSLKQAGLRRQLCAVVGAVRARRHAGRHRAEAARRGAQGGGGPKVVQTINRAGSPLSTRTRRSSRPTGMPTRSGKVMTEAVNRAKPIGKVECQRAPISVNQNSREPMSEPDEMVPLWKILHLVGADWTYSSRGWAAENFCMFTGNEAAWRDVIAKRVDAVNDLGCAVWLNTECGHSYYSMWQGVQRFGLDAHFRMESLITYYAQWIREGRLPINSKWNTRGIKFTVQDPCMIVRKSYGDAMADDMRFVVRTLVGDENFVDMQPNRSANYCCGGGGGFLQAGMTDHRRAYGKRKFDQIAATQAAYVLTPCHNCHSQIEDLGRFYKGQYGVVHFWTLMCLSLGILGENERHYLGPDLRALID
jgi:hypothetical protein